MRFGIIRSVPVRGNVVISSANHPAARIQSAASRRRNADRRRFRQAMFESLEDRRLLASFPAPVSSWEKAEIIDDEVLVKLAPSVTPQQQFEFRSILTSYGALERQTWDELNM